MIFIDSSIPMYLVGADHPHRTDAQRHLERAIVAGDALVTDVEVFQEILDRYVAIDRRDAIAPAWELLAAITDQLPPSISTMSPRLATSCSPAPPSRRATRSTLP